MEKELERIKKYYTKRDNERVEWRGNSKGGVFYRNIRFISHSKEDALFEMLGKLGFQNDTFPNLSIMDIGCGDGNLLASFVRYGANPKNLYGIDLMPNRIFDARDNLPEANLSVANGADIPYNENSFHITTLFTVLSAIKDTTMRDSVIREALRVSYNAVIIFDFFRMGIDENERVVSISELAKWADGNKLYFKTIIPNFKILSKIVKFSPICARVVENCKFLNTHFMAVIKKEI